MHSYPRTQKHGGKATPYYIPSCSTVVNVVAICCHGDIGVQPSSEEMTREGGHFAFSKEYNPLRPLLHPPQPDASADPGPCTVDHQPASLLFRIGYGSSAETHLNTVMLLISCLVMQLSLQFLSSGRPFI
jgi:hypothetical protein